jgi:cyclase
LVASGGAGETAHFCDAVRAGADALLAASVYHFGLLTVTDVKNALAADGFDVRQELPSQ